jgi:hypothetical protein
MLNNQDIYILNRVNELAERFGIRPYSFIATVKDAALPNGDRYSEPETVRLMIESLPLEPAEAARMGSLLSHLGGRIAEEGLIIAPVTEVATLLDDALSTAPRPRGRG